MSDDQQLVVLDPPKPHSNKQKLIMQALQMPGLDETWVACGTKFGKAQSIKTPIPTPDGWRTLGDIKEGDYVFDEKGQPTLVEFATDVMHGHRCLMVAFSDGTDVICDAEHLWTTTTHADRKNMARAKSPKDRCKSTKASPKTLTTQEIQDTVYVDIGGFSRPNHAVDCMAGPAQFAETDLPIPPYTLGVWLGDGSSWSGQITCDDIPTMEEIVRDGYEVKKQQAPFMWGVKGLTTQLKQEGLYRNKHVPAAYLTASPAQRLALLQGLMDTDGTISARGHCCFDNTNELLSDAVEALALSFGLKVHRAEKFPKLYGVTHKTCYRVMFTTELPVFRLFRKLARLRPVSSKSKRRYIVGVYDTPSVPVKCIRVANPSHLFLCSRAFIPTHNTLGAVGGWLAAAVALQKPMSHCRVVAPIYRQAQISLDYSRQMLPKDPAISMLKQSDNSIYLLPEITNRTLTGYKTRLEFLHGQDPYSLEGAAVDKYLFDEYAKQSPKVYASAMTTTTRTNGSKLFVSTPLGKNHFYDGCMEAKEMMEWALRKGQRPTKIFITAPTSANPTIDPAIIAAAQRNLPFRLFQQFYLAMFIDDGSVFVGHRQCVFGQPQEVEGEHLKWTDYGAKERYVVVGADWAKTQDWTVFFAIDVETRKVVGYQRFHKRAYTEAVRLLGRFCRQFKEVLGGYHDKTGVGVAIDEMVQNLPYPVQGLTFTNQSKGEMINRLISRFELRDLGIPNWGILLSELDAFEGETNALGTLIYGAPDGKHDDTVCALALANAALVDTEGSMEVTFTDEDPKKKREEDGEPPEPMSALENFYDDLADDLDD